MHGITFERFAIFFMKSINLCIGVSVMASQIAVKSTVCSTAYSGQQHRKRPISALLAFSSVMGIQRGFPSQRASNRESVCMSWRPSIILTSVTVLKIEHEVLPSAAYLSCLHTHTHIYIYVCVCVCVFVGMH